MKRRLLAGLAIFAAFFVLYALTAQRGLGWGDYGEFQYRILSLGGDILRSNEFFARVHPLYTAFARACCSTPFAVTLVSSFFGAVAVAGFYLLTRKIALAVVFGLAHMLWWLSCVADAQTMNLAFTVFETAAFLKFIETRRGGWFALTCLLSGIHLEVHNLALLALPVYAVAAFRPFDLRRNVVALALWAIGAAYWLWALAVLGPQSVLVGRWGAEVAGVLPSDWTTTAFNLALSGMSFFVPLVLWHWHRRDVKLGRAQPLARPSGWIIALFAVNAIFFVRYFIQDQATYLLPTLFFAFLMVAEATPRVNRAVALALMEIALPLFAAKFLATMEVPPERALRHPGRNEANYFALPWKFQDDSADRFAAVQGGVWKGGE